MAPKYRTQVPPGQSDEDEVKGMERISKTEFKARLGAAMRKKRWYPSELARRAGIGRDSVSGYLNARTFPSPTNLRKLAEALGVKAEDLLPNYSLAAVKEDTTPGFVLRASASDPSLSWISVDRLVYTATGIMIAGLLAEDDAPSKGK